MRMAAAVKSALIRSVMSILKILTYWSLAYVVSKLLAMPLTIRDHSITTTVRKKL